MSLGGEIKQPSSLAPPVFIISKVNLRNIFPKIEVQYVIE